MRWPAVIFPLALVLLVLATAGLGLTVYPQAASAGSYSVAATAVGSISPMSSTNYKAEGLTYETTGEMGSTSYRACIGWYCAAVSIAAPYSLRLTGMLNYSNGTLVTNTRVTLTAYNTTLNAAYSVDGSTDSAGNFVLTLSNIPAGLIDSGFAIKITAYGAVEAVFDRPCKMAGGKLECK